jgi:hypothetical protein
MFTSDVFLDIHQTTAAARAADSGAIEHDRHLRELLVARRRRQARAVSRRIRLRLLPTG